MKTVSLIPFVMCLCLISCSQSADKKTQDPVQKGWKGIDNSKYSIQYPENWDVDNSGQMGTSFFLFSRQTSPQDQFKENVNLIIQDLSAHNINLDQYVEISVDQIKTMITNGNLLTSERVNRNNTEFHKVIYTGDQGVYKLKFEQYFWVTNKNAYVLTFTCEVAQFDTYKEIGEKILNSFVIK
jgi:hypothetical protein